MTYGDQSRVDRKLPRPHSCNMYLHYPLTTTTTYNLEQLTSHVIMLGVTHLQLNYEYYVIAHPGKKRFSFYETSHIQNEERNFIEVGWFALWLTPGTWYKDLKSSQWKEAQAYYDTTCLQSEKCLWGHHCLKFTSIKIRS